MKGLEHHRPTIHTTKEHGERSRIRRKIDFLRGTHLVSTKFVMSLSTLVLFLSSSRESSVSVDSDSLIFRSSYPPLSFPRTFIFGWFFNPLLSMFSSTALFQFYWILFFSCNNDI